MTDGLLAGTLM